VRDLGLFEAYLVQLRQTRLEQGHARTLASTSPADYADIKGTAREAQLISHLLGALRALTSDPGQFIKEYLTK
jgi:hypothetical protein